MTLKDDCKPIIHDIIHIIIPVFREYPQANIFSLAKMVSKFIIMSLFLLMRYTGWQPNEIIYHMYLFRQILMKCQNTLFQ